MTSNIALVFGVVLQIHISLLLVFVGCLHLCNMLVYLRDRFAYTVVHAGTLRQQF